MTKIPILSVSPPQAIGDLSLIEELLNQGFEGEISTEYAQRVVGSTDNSIYQLLPSAIIMPKTEADVQKLMQTIALPAFQSIKITARGGGTGTNGQSLNQGFILDFGKYFNHILSHGVDEAGAWVWVECGVVLDQLNAYLAQKLPDYFFAPNLSPSNRATIGGMINTDAAGEGSRIYGKTSEHVLELKAFFIGGHEHLAPEKQAQIESLLQSNQEIIDQDLPKLDRFVTGYDLIHSYLPQEGLKLNRLLCGSEGSLAVITKAKLRLTLKPKHSALIVFKYPSFDQALGAAKQLLSETLKLEPSSIETIDEKILFLAKEKDFYTQIKHCIEYQGEQREDCFEIKAINLVEFKAYTADEALQKAKHCIQSIAGKIELLSPFYYLTESEKEIKALWDLRKKGVGLLANLKGNRQPIAFVEDTVVPPAVLQEYIREFRAILDRRGVQYGLFGHVDVGCLHVRPALDIKKQEDEKQLFEISQEVFELVRKYKGVIWGEHGKGFRSAYSPATFGPRLYPILQEIKGIFDPFNQLNPGKIATAKGSALPLASIDSPLRGQQDRLISEQAQIDYEVSIKCNGNAQCMDYDHHHLMCPSSHATRNRVNSPKGRAGLMREWLKQLSLKGFEASQEKAIESSRLGISDWLLTLIKAKFASYSKDQPQQYQQAQNDFSKEVYASMSACLSCKACATKCPVKVDIPNLKSQFLAFYHQRYPRPLKDMMIASLEHISPYLAIFPSFTNLQLSLGKGLIKHVVGLVDLPLFSHKKLWKTIKTAQKAELNTLKALNETQKQRSVILLLDSFHRYFHIEVVEALALVLDKLGIQLYIDDQLINGKALHVKGFLGSFYHIAQKQSQRLEAFGQTGIPMLCLEPAIALTYADEYPKILGKAVNFKVSLIHQWLEAWINEHPECTQVFNPPIDSEQYYLYAHCTERSFVENVTTSWERIFKKFQLPLLSPEVGCCGMCGAFGHEIDHYEESKLIYEQSWQKSIQARQQGQQSSKEAYILTTGYSCHSQVKRFNQINTLHPIQSLAKLLKNT